MTKMDNETAVHINQAACRIWLWKHDLSISLQYSDIALIQTVSIPQMETASEVVEELNAHAPRNANGTRTISCTPSCDAMREIKDYANSIEI